MTPKRLLVLVLLLLAPSAAAHTRSVSYSVWTLTEAGASVRVKLRALDHNAIQAALQSADPQAVRAYLQKRLVLRRGEVACQALVGVQQLPAAPRWVRFGWEVRCNEGETGPTVVEARLLFDVMPSHLHFARVDGPGDPVELLLSDRERAKPLIAAEGAVEAGATGTDYLALGVVHILGGLDHLVFLFTLLLIAVRVRDAALAVTGFTVGHSVTLALAATGVASPESAVVEALVGLTIAWVAAENIWLVGARRDQAIPVAVVATTAAAGVVAFAAGVVPPQVLLGAALSVGCYLALMARVKRPERARWLVAAVFGLVHGFAFASLLGEHQLSGADLAWPLLSFNLGVELGQLGVLLVAWPLWIGLKRVAGEKTPVLVGSAAAMALGMFWFTGRAFFGAT